MEILKQFKALSDPTRLRLLFILEHFELNVNEIVSVVDMVQSEVSRHLKILRDAGLWSHARTAASFIIRRTKPDIPGNLFFLPANSLKTNLDCRKILPVHSNVLF